MCDKGLTGSACCATLFGHFSTTGNAVSTHVGRKSKTMLARTSLLRPLTFLFNAPGAGAAHHRGHVTTANVAQPILALPFDAMRQHYAGAVIAGLVPRSLLDSARLERWLDALEMLMLGPLARYR